jgi:hypothetical protein
MQKIDEIKKRIMNDEDFINSPNHKNSLKCFIAKNPEGVSNDRIAKVLMISEEEVEEIYLSAIEKLKEGLARFK